MKGEVESLEVNQQLRREGLFDDVEDDEDLREFGRGRRRFFLEALGAAVAGVSTSIASSAGGSFFDLLLRPIEGLRRSRRRSSKNFLRATIEQSEISWVDSNY